MGQSSYEIPSWYYDITINIIYGYMIQGIFSLYDTRAALTFNKFILIFDDRFGHQHTPNHYTAGNFAGHAT